MDIAYCRWIIDKHMESGYFTMEILHSDINYVNVHVSIIMSRLSVQVFFLEFCLPKLSCSNFLNIIFQKQHQLFNFNEF